MCTWSWAESAASVPEINSSRISSIGLCITFAGVGCRVQGAGCRVQGGGFRVWELKEV